MEKQKTIYNLELHETLNIRDSISVIKVHGGWIYQNMVRTNTGSFVAMQNTFVPYEPELILETKGDIQFLPKRE